MTDTEPSALPPDIEAVRVRIEEWRRTRKTRARMPEGLWRAAVELVPEHGITRVSNLLRVKHERLKARIELSASAQSGAGGRSRAPEFVDLTSALSAPPPRSGAATLPTTIEVSRADGTRLSVRLADASAIDLRCLVHAFCQSNG